MRISDWSSDVCSSDLRVLRRLGLQLAGRGDVGDQRDVEEQAALAAELVTELADRLQEGQPLDVADGAADLADDEVLVGEVRAHEGLDGVGDVGDDLHGGAEIVAAPLARQDLRVDLSRGHVVRSEEHTSELQSLMRISYAVFCLKK